MSDCRFGVSPINYPDPDPEDSDWPGHSLRLISLRCALNE